MTLRQSFSEKLRMVKLKPNNLNNVTVLQSNGTVLRSKAMRSNGRELYSEALRSKGKARLNTEVQRRSPVLQGLDEQSNGKAQHRNAGQWQCVAKQWQGGVLLIDAMARRSCVQRCHA